MEKSPAVKDGRELDAAARAVGWHVCKAATLCVEHAEDAHACAPIPAPPPWAPRTAS